MVGPAGEMASSLFAVAKATMGTRKINRPGQCRGHISPLCRFCPVTDAIEPRDSVWAYCTYQAAESCYPVDLKV